ncbi:MAG: ribonuclease Z [Candidatus Cloacimonetes bacterium]|nr:ribonuclease Z [Candidatus Cloacimonadota bacterium]
MLVKFLGTAPGMPQLNQRHSSILLQGDNLTILFDCGEGVSQAFLKERINVDDVDVIFISHTHPDHLAGIYMLLQHFYLQKRTKGLDIYLPECLDIFESSLDYMYIFKDTLGFPINLMYCEQIGDNHNEIAIFVTNHLERYTDFVKKNQVPNKMYSFGISIVENGKKLTYTSDITNIAEVWDYLQKSDYLIVDALHPEEDEMLDLDNVIKEKVYLTHGITQKLTFLVENNPKYKIAKDGDSFSF